MVSTGKTITITEYIGESPLNRFAYQITGHAIKTLSLFSKAKIHLHDEANIPEGSLIFVVNHFTRMETLFLPYHIYYLTGKKPVWSLGDDGLFSGPLGDYMSTVGGVSATNPDRDTLIVKSLLTGEASWIIYPEGLMASNNMLAGKGRFMSFCSGGRLPPHTGAATLAFRTEFYRKRLITLSETLPDEAARLMSLFQIENLELLKSTQTCIIPVNITYYPIRARENALSRLAEFRVDNPSERMLEEIMKEGASILSGMDIDVRFGEPVAVQPDLADSAIERDISRASAFGFDDPIASRTAMRRRALTIRQRYMTSMCRMTRVNPDHLFASMLKQYPFKKIDSLDLRRRVFLAASQEWKPDHLFTHDILTDHPIHLLTDDVHNRCADFIRFAVEKGIWIQKGNDLIKSNLPAAAVSEFPLLRIDNPVAEIASEVEPLTHLQRRIRCLAWQPGFRIRRQVARCLMEKSLSDFERDYTMYAIEGESRDQSVGRPILIKGKFRRPGIVLFHGYMAAPMELRGLAEYLAQKGWWVYVPRLKGHGTAPEDLSIRGYADWIISADEGYALISSSCSKVVAGGFSMGGGLALEMASRISHPSLAGVFAVCPPFRLQDYSAKLVPAMNIWNRLMTSVKRDEAKKEYVDNQPENPDINYLRNPVSGVHELGKLMKLVESRLKDIRMPALMIQADEDPVVDEKGTQKAFRLLGSVRKHLILFQSKRHGIVWGEGSEHVFQTIGDFVSHL